MSDNVAITAGSGTTIAADEVVDGTLGTVKVQYVKIMDATLDGTTKAAVGANGLKVDGSGATQPVSGTVTANIGTSGSLALDATLTGGTQQTKITDGTNVATVKAASTAAGATDKAVVVAVSPNNAVAVTGTFWQATQPISGTITANIGTVGALAQNGTLTNGTMATGLYDATTLKPFVIKPASTAAVAADCAMVVAISPNNAVAVTGTFWQATQPISGTVTTTPPSNASSNVAQINAVTPLMGNGVTGTGSQRVTIASDNTAFSVNAVQSGTWNIGTVTTVSAVTAISNALPAGTNIIGHVIDDASATAGGISTTARLASAAASTNATNVKGSAGRIYSACGKNNAAYDIFLVLYDALTNPPVPGTTTIRKKMVCPAGQAFVYDWPLGLSCATGIGYAFTKLVADADTTVLVAADITAFNLDYV